MDKRKDEPLTIPLYRGWTVRFSDRSAPAPRIERRRESRPVARERRRAV